MDGYQEIEKFFSETGLLSEKYPDFEFRKSQKEMAIAVADILEAKSHIFIEAPTGIGKSFAYLVPAILFAKKNKKKAVISTCTINLQEQLINKDIPFLQEVLPVGFRAALIKGKSNYLCPKRLKKVLENANTLFETEEKICLEQIYSWSKVTNDGTLSDISFPVKNEVWDSVCAEKGICTNKTCGNIKDTECFYQKAKYNASISDVIIINHHLFFTLFDGLKKKDSDGYLYNNDFVIFDEAHTIENIAASNIVPSVSREMIKYYLLKLYNDKKKKGLLLKYPALHILPVIQNLLDLNEHFFSLIRRRFFKHPADADPQLTVRIFEKNMFENMLTAELINLVENLKTLRQFSKDDLDENQLQDFVLKFSEINYLIDNFIGQKNLAENQKFVYWIELSSLKPGANVSLSVSPIDISGFFRDYIFKENNSCILTSATLSINGNFDYYKTRLGAEVCSDLRLPSPFDFYNQVKAYVVKDIPVPGRSDDNEYKQKLIFWLNYFIDMTGGKALVLFTNSFIMKAIGTELKNLLDEKGIRLLIQGEGDSSRNLLKKFRKDVNSVLFGLDSFWLGVDVPGEALSNLIITKLPFLVPVHPLIQARLEYIDENGGNSFMDYSLPESILKFRQGFGRLIRNKKDSGILVILDSRVLTKSYGKFFMNAIEDCRLEII